MEAQSTGHLSGDPWVEKKDILHRLYVREKKTLPEVKAIMEREYGFRAAPLSTYEIKLNKLLGLRKNLKRSDWLIVEEHLKARGQKPTEVLLCGKIMEPKTLRRKIMRARGRGVLSGGCDIHEESPLPNGVVIRTPQSSPRMFTAIEEDNFLYHEEAFTGNDALWGITTPPFQLPFPISYSPWDPNPGFLAVPSPNLPLMDPTFSTMTTTIPEIQGHFSQFPSLAMQPDMSSNLGELSSLTQKSFLDLSSEIARFYDTDTASGLGWQAQRGFTRRSVGISVIAVAALMKDSPFSRFRQDLRQLMQALIVPQRHHLRPVERQPSHADQFGLGLSALSCLGTRSTLGNVTDITSQQLGDQARTEGVGDILTRLLETLFYALFSRRGSWGGYALQILQKFEEYTSWTYLKSSLRLALLETEPLMARESWINLIKAAARYKRADLFEVLLDIGFQRPEWIKKFGSRCLLMAGFVDNPPRFDSTSIIRRLIEQGVSPYAEIRNDLYFRRAPFHLAADNCNYSLLSYLLDAGIEVDHRDSQGYTLLGLVMMAKVDQSNKVPCIQLLIQAGADGQAPMKRGGRKPDSGSLDLELSHVDWAYLNVPELYYSCFEKYESTASFTISGILSASANGREALNSYVNSKLFFCRPRRDLMLEKALYSLCTPSSIERRVKAARELLNFGVDADAVRFRRSMSSRLFDNHTFSTSMMIPCPSEFILSGMEPDTLDQDLELLTLFIRSGAAINFPVALAQAASTNQIHALELLINNVNDADVPIHGVPALVCAARCNNADAVSLLCKHGVSINSQLRGISVLAHALGHDGDKDFPSTTANAAMFQLLLDLGARIAPPVDRDILEIILRSAAEDSREKVEIMVRQGVDFSCWNGLSLTLTTGTWDVWRHNNISESNSQLPAVLELLLDHNFPITQVKLFDCRRKEECVLSLLILIKVDIRLVRRLLDAGVNINPRREECYRTPLQAAALVGNMDLVKELLRRGAYINPPAPGSRSNTVLACACQSEEAKLELIQYLIENGADVNAVPPKSEWAALEVASVYGRVDVLSTLLDAGARWNRPDQDMSALDIAAWKGRIEAVHLLVKIGVKSARTGETGYDYAIELAERGDHWSVAQVIRQYARDKELNDFIRTL